MTPCAVLAVRGTRLVAALHGAPHHASGSCAAGSSSGSFAVGLFNRVLVASPGPTLRLPGLRAAGSIVQTATPEPVAHEAPAAEWQQRSPEVVAAVDGNPTGMQLTFLGTGASVLTPGRHACWTPV